VKFKRLLAAGEANRWARDSKSFEGVGKGLKSLSLPVFGQMSASECSTSNGRAVSAEEVKCQSIFEAKSRVQARARLLRIMKMNP
jgi:hypothetical protein